MHSLATIALAFTLFGIWMLTTYLLEGRTRTPRRPEASDTQAAYAVVANLLVGTVGAAMLVGAVTRFTPGLRAVEFGFSSPSRTIVYVALASILGLLVYEIQDPAPWRAVLLVNVFSQTLAGSAAEVLVCWSAVGVAIARLPLEPGWATAAGLVVAAGASATYHVAHGRLSSTPGMVGRWFGMGLLTGGFFFLVRDVVATIVLHNFLALSAVAAADEPARLAAGQRLQPRLLGMAVATLIWVALLMLLVIRIGN